jgi:addiction module HigA family antidote
VRLKDPIHPGEFILDEFLLPANKSQRDLAEKLSWTPARLNELIKGKRGITAEAALYLAYVLGTSSGALDESSKSLRPSRSCKIAQKGKLVQLPVYPKLFLSV